MRRKNGLSDWVVVMFGAACMRVCVWAVISSSRKLFTSPPNSHDLSYKCLLGATACNSFVVCQSDTAKPEDTDDEGNRAEAVEPLGRGPALLGRQDEKANPKADNHGKKEGEDDGRALQVLLQSADEAHFTIVSTGLRWNACKRKGERLGLCGIP